MGSASLTPQAIFQFLSHQIKNPVQYLDSYKPLNIWFLLLHQFSLQILPFYRVFFSTILSKSPWTPCARTFLSFTNTLPCCIISIAYITTLNAFVHSFVFSSMLYLPSLDLSAIWATTMLSYLLCTSKNQNSAWHMVEAQCILAE